MNLWDHGAAIEARDEARFWAKVSIGPGCWEWLAATHKGYGVMLWRGRMRPASRVSWEIHNGTIPDGLHVLHRCDNRRCANPAHLFLGTNQDNVEDMVAKGRQARGAALPHSKLSLEKASVIREARQRGARYSDLARAYGVSENAIRQVITGRSYRSLVVR